IAPANCPALQSGHAFYAITDNAAITALRAQGSQGIQIRTKVRDVAGNDGYGYGFYAVGTTSVPQNWFITAEEVKDSAGILNLSHPLDLDAVPGVSAQALNLGLAYNSSLVRRTATIQVSVQLPIDLPNGLLPGISATLTWDG